MSIVATMTGRLMSGAGGASGPHLGELPIRRRADELRLDPRVFLSDFSPLVDPRRMVLLSKTRKKATYFQISND
jgi:hypothetical protein